jgi:hypothetical protein
LLRINTRKYDVSSKPVNQKEEERIEDTDLKVFDLENIPDGLY